MSVGLNKVTQTQQSQLSLSEARVRLLGWGVVGEMEKPVSGGNFFKKLGCELAKMAVARTREDVD